MLTEVDGDLFEEGLPALAHGCNTTGVMGAGIALAFKERYPEMYDSYVDLCERKRFRLGHVFPWYDEDGDVVVFNLATQALPGAHASLTAICHATKAAIDIAVTLKGVDAIGLPRIGCGIGGLKWESVQLMLKDIARTAPVDLVVCSI